MVLVYIFALRALYGITIITKQSIFLGAVSKRITPLFSKKCHAWNKMINSLAFYYSNELEGVKIVFVWNV